jgi:hypothetical protein
VTSARQRAWTALSAQLERTLSPAARGALVGGTHTRRFADNLVPGLNQRQVASLRSQLAAGAGGELNATPSNKRRAHASYSSAALAASAYGRWLGDEANLVVAGLIGFDQPLTIEHKLKIPNHGGVANLDCVLQGPDLLVGIESKLTETLTPHDPVTWRPPYHKPEMGHKLGDGWEHVLAISLRGEWAPKHLGIEQLLKHALALARHASGRTAHLVYCYWEPINADDIPEVLAHRKELATLEQILDGDKPHFHALTYAELAHEWSLLATPRWIPEHLSDLRDRYWLSI